MISLLIDLIFVAIAGGLLYWIVSLLPIPQPFKQIALVCVLLICLLWLLSGFFGGVGYAPHTHFHLP